MLIRLAALVIVLLAAVVPADAEAPAHVERDIEGWTCHIDPQLVEGEHKALGDEALRIVANQLFDITLLLSPERATDLPQVHLLTDRLVTRAGGQAEAAVHARVHERCERRQ